MIGKYSTQLWWWICFLPQFHKMLTDGLESCGLLVDYSSYVFISCLDSHSDGTHSLQRILWWASDVILNFSKSVSMNKQTHLHLGCCKGENISSKLFIFEWTIPLMTDFDPPPPPSPPHTHTHTHTHTYTLFCMLGNCCGVTDFRCSLSALKYHRKQTVVGCFGDAPYWLFFLYIADLYNLSTIPLL